MDLDTNCPFKVGTLYKYPWNIARWRCDPLKRFIPFNYRNESVVEIKGGECFILLEIGIERGNFYGKILLKNETVWLPLYGNMIEVI